MDLGRIEATGEWPRKGTKAQNGAATQSLTADFADDADGAEREKQKGEPQKAEMRTEAERSRQENSKQKRTK